MKFVVKNQPQISTNFTRFFCVDFFTPIESLQWKNPGDRLCIVAEL